MALEHGDSLGCPFLASPQRLTRIDLLASVELLGGRWIGLADLFEELTVRTRDETQVMVANI